MTRHKHAHTGLVTPSLPQLLLTATLRLFAMLVSSLASTLWMRLRRPLVIGTQATPQLLPEAKIDTQQQEANSVAASDTLPKALMVSSTQSVRPSNHERVLTGIRREPSGSGPLVRVPREGGDPATPKLLVRACSFGSAQVSPPALDPRLRGGHGRESWNNSAPA